MPRIHHPDNLRIRQAPTEWIAPDITSQNTQLAPVLDTVGEYDVLGVMASLDQDARIELQLGVNEGETRRLVVPRSMVKEWLVLREQY